MRPQPSEKNLVRTFEPPASLHDFMDDRSFIRGVKGPVGSGKTSLVMCMDSIYKACRQTPSPLDGVRYSKEIIVRCDMPRLKTSTIRTWLQWVPPEVFGSELTWGPPASHHLRWEQKPGDIVDLEVIFWGFEGEVDVEKLDGFEVSRARINAASESDFAVFSRLCERVNRFPGKEHGFCAEPGVTMDFNAPNADHWLYQMMEVHTPQNARFWDQPPALFSDPEGELISLDGTRYSVNDKGDLKHQADPSTGIPRADNIDNLNGNYYRDMVTVRTDANIKVFLQNKFGFLADGDAVHPLFDEDSHWAGSELITYPGLPLLLGLDWGSTPACAIAQYTPKGQLRVLDEVCADHYTSVPRFLDEKLIPHLKANYPGMETTIEGVKYMAHGWGDPAGVAGKGYEDTAFDECTNRGLYVVPAPDPQNIFDVRVKALDTLFGTLIEGGKKGIVISNKCQMLRAGLGGRYKFSKMKSGSSHNSLKKDPDKNEFSHICEGLQYLALGIVGAPQEMDHFAKNAIDNYNNSLTPMGRGGY